MSERELTLDLPGADLPGAGDPVITDVIAGALSSIDTSLPGASSQAAGALGIEAGAEQVLLILVDGLGYELIQDHLGHTPTLRRVRDDIRSIHTVVPSTTPRPSRLSARVRALAPPTWWASPLPTAAAS